MSFLFSEASTRPPDVDFETTEVLVQCDEEEEGDEEEGEDEDQGEGEEMMVVDMEQEEEGEALSFLCSVCRHHKHTAPD